MLWLASFPRSGNTFFRNVLFEVYGLSSGAYHRDPQRVLDPNYADHPVVKTHLLPAQLPSDQRKWPAVYLLRDGRDSLVSIAHHRKDIIAPGSNFYLNLLQAIVALNGSYFGGWSHNVAAWVQEGALVIHFADLINQPLSELERLRHLTELPQPQVEKLPTFEELKFGKPAYRATAQVAQGNQKHFRKGKVGGWKEEMPPELHALFWLYHGEMMRKHGFVDGQVTGLRQPERRRAIWESIFQQLESLKPELSAAEQDAALAMLVAVRRKLQGAGSEKVALGHFGYETYLLRLKAAIRRSLPAPLYRKLAGLYRRLPVRRWLQQVRSRFVRKPL